MRVTSPAVTIKDIWDALVADYGAAGTYGLLLETNLDGKVSEAKADLTTLETAVALYLDAKVSEAKADVSALALEATVDTLAGVVATIAGYLDTEIQAIIDGVAAIPTTAQRGTDGAALASVYTADRAGYLDNIDASLAELFYEHFAVEVDDLPDVSISSAVPWINPANIWDNDTATNAQSNTAGQYIEFDFAHVCYIKRVRIYGDPTSNPNNRFSVQAYVDGAWVDALTGIEDPDASAWTAWLDFDTPRTAILWRFKITTYDTSCYIGEIEFDGVTLG